MSERAFPVWPYRPVRSTLRCCCLCNKPLQPVSRVTPPVFACPRTGGLDDTLHTIIDYACEQNIPFVFALNRKALGRSLNKAVPVSVVGIFSYDGAQVRGQQAPAGGRCPGWEAGEALCLQAAPRGLGLSGLCFPQSPEGRDILD